MFKTSYKITLEDIVSKGMKLNIVCDSDMTQQQSVENSYVNQIERILKPKMNEAPRAKTSNQEIWKDKVHRRRKSLKTFLNSAW